VVHFPGSNFQWNKTFGGRCKSESPVFLNRLFLLKTIAKEFCSFDEHSIVEIEWLFQGDASGDEMNSLFLTYLNSA
jgi:hypothetical protein